MPWLFRWRVRMPAVVCHSDHLAHLNLLRVEWKAMSEACLGVVEPERQFVELESAISRIGTAAVAQRLHCLRLHGFEILRYFQRLLQCFWLVNTGNCSRHRQTHRVSERFFAGENSFLYRISMATDRLHPERGDSPAIQLRQHLLLEAVKVRVERIQRHLHRVKWKARS